jgi:hypothetical protein
MIVGFQIEGARRHLDEGQFGAPIILTAFNYAYGLQEGVQFTGSYDRGPWSIYANIAVSRAVGKDITSAQFNFGPDELAFSSAVTSFTWTAIRSGTALPASPTD